MALKLEGLRVSSSDNVFTLSTLELVIPPDVRVGELDFNPQFDTVKNISFPVVLGFS